MEINGRQCLYGLHPYLYTGKLPEDVLPTVYTGIHSIQNSPLFYPSFNAMQANSIYLCMINSLETGLIWTSVDQSQQIYNRPPNCEGEDNNSQFVFERTFYNYLITTCMLFCCFPQGTLLLTLDPPNWNLLCF